MPVHVRQVWAGVQNRKNMEALYLKGKPQKAQESVNFLRRLPPDLIQGLEPATDQQQLCSILEGVGAKIMDLTKNFPNTGLAGSDPSGEAGRQRESHRHTGPEISILVPGVG